jgi:3-oxoacyl-[acyl-carrier-protein] synthase III
METNSVAIRGCAAELGESFRTLTSLQLDPNQYAELTGLYVTDQLPQLVRKAAVRALASAAVAPDDIDLLLSVAALPESQLVRPASTELLDRFSYVGTWLQHELDLVGARTIGIGQQGCSALFAAFEIAQAKLCSDRSLRNILCVGADALPANARRTIFHNAISDAAVAVVVSRGRAKYRLLGLEQLSKAYFWDTAATETQLLATYFPSGKTIVHRLFERLRMRSTDIDAVIPTGIRRSSWPILLQLWGIPVERCLYPAEQFGHTIQADPILALEAAEESGALKSGMRLLLFTFGFGATWSAAVLEVGE